MRGTTSKLLGVAVGVAVAGVLIGFYVSKLTTDNGSPAYTVPVQTANGHPVVDLKIETVAAVGPQLSSNPDFVSYLIQDTKGQWKRDTVWRLPANATVHVTIYNFDGASGLRNPYLARPLGIDGNVEMIDGKPADGINPDDTSHTFAVPAYHLIVPIPGVADNAKNQCGYAPCAIIERAPHHHVHVPHGREGPLPLAVLRALRRRLARRLRWPDADDRLHGRVPGRRLANEHASERAAGELDRSRATGTDRVDRAERDRDSPRLFRARPRAPAGQEQRAGSGAGVRQHGPRRVRHADRLPAASCSSSTS